MGPGHLLGPNQIQMVHGLVALPCCVTRPASASAFPAARGTSKSDGDAYGHSVIPDNFHCGRKRADVQLGPARTYGGGPGAHIRARGSRILYYQRPSPDATARTAFKGSTRGKRVL